MYIQENILSKCEHFLIKNMNCHGCNIPTSKAQEFTSLQTNIKIYWKGCQNPLSPTLFIYYWSIAGGNGLRLQLGCISRLTPCKNRAKNKSHLRWPSWAWKHNSWESAHHSTAQLSDCPSLGGLNFFGTNFGNSLHLHYKEFVFVYRTVLLSCNWDLGSILRASPLPTSDPVSDRAGSDRAQL